MPAKPAKKPTATAKARPHAATLPPVEREALADGSTKEPVEASADGSTADLVSALSGAAESDEDLAQCEAIAALPADRRHKASSFIVRALQSFGDNETRQDYKPGDVVPWDRERAERYAARGLVVIEEMN